MQRINVLQDIGLSICYENHVKLVKRLVDVSHTVLFDCSVLGVEIEELGERSEKSFYA